MFELQSRVEGMAPGATLINLRVLDQNGVSADSTVIQAIDYAISIKSQYNIRVINLSLGRPVYESYKLDPLCQAVEAAWKAGDCGGSGGRQRWPHKHGQQQRLWDDQLARATIPMSSRWAQ